MLTGNLYVQAVEAIYASGLDSELVPEALAATSRLLGARGATREVIDKATQRPVEFHSAGLPGSRARDIEINRKKVGMRNCPLPLWEKVDRCAPRQRDG